MGVIVRFNSSSNFVFTFCIETAVEIIVLPHSTGTLTVGEYHDDNGIGQIVYSMSRKHAAFYVLSGVCLCLVFLSCICCLIYLHFRCKNRRDKEQEGVVNEGRMHSLSPRQTPDDTTVNDKSPLVIREALNLASTHDEEVIDDDFRNVFPLHDSVGRIIIPHS